MPTTPHNRQVRNGDVTLSVAELGEAGAPAVVLIHGYPDTKTVWSPVMERLAAEGFRAIAYDVRGAGESSAPAAQRAYDLECLADDFAAVCDAVAGPDHPPVHLVGHDWGGIQGWEFVTDARLAGRIASFTSVAGPALSHASRATRGAAGAGQVLQSLNRIRRSWYIAPLCTPGGPSLAWRLLVSPDRWRRYLAAEGVPPSPDYPAPTLREDGLHGANLYRQNILRRAGRPSPVEPALAPVQLLIPEHDRYISPSYYDAAEEAAPGLRRRSVPGSHWAPRTHPDLVAEWVAEWAREVERGSAAR